MKKKHILFVMLVGFAAGWGILKYRSGSSMEEPEAVWVQATVVKESSLAQETHAIGTLTARHVVITPEMAGHVEKIYFKDGDKIKKGDLLIQLDDAVYKAKYESAKAKYVFSQTDYDRKVLLGKKGAIAQQAIDAALADLKEKKADMQESEVMLNKMKLAAPFEGTLGKCEVNIGDYVTIGQHLVTVTDTQPLRIEYNVPENLLSALKIGQEVKVETSAYPGEAFVGLVTFVSPTINSDNRSVSLYAEIANLDNKLAPGMFVNVTHHLASMKKSLIIPARSLMPGLNGEEIYKVVNGKVVSTPVVVGQRAENSVQVTKGLKVGEVVVTDGQLKVRNGMRVKIKS